MRTNIIVIVARGDCIYLHSLRVPRSGHRSENLLLLRVLVYENEFQNISGRYSEHLSFYKCWHCSRRITCNFPARFIEPIPQREK